MFFVISCYIFCGSAKLKVLFIYNVIKITYKIYIKINKTQFTLCPFINFKNFFSFIFHFFFCIKCIYQILFFVIFF